jgi:DNA (cytosine-5)-methyltransferase 1
LYRVLDLFAGAGGLSLVSSKQKKFEVIIAIEKNPSAKLTYKKTI